MANDEAVTKINVPKEFEGGTFNFSGDVVTLTNEGGTVKVPNQHVQSFLSAVQGSTQADTGNTSSKQEGNI